MKSAKNFRQRLGLTIVITVGATYIISLLVVGLLMTATTVTAPMAQIIRLVIAIVIGVSAWNLLGKRDSGEHGNSNPSVQ